MKNNFNNIFKDIVFVNKNKIAIEISNQKITFGALDKSSDIYSKILQKKYKIKVDDSVCITSEKKLINFIFLFSCLKIGAKVTFLDIDSPIKRIQNIINQLEPKLIFDSDEKLKGINKKLIKIILNKRNIVKINTKSYKDYKIEYPGLDVIAYIMFTSGSTGEPKGVPITQKKLLNFVKLSKIHLGIDKNDVFSNLNPLFFDNSIFDVYVSLLNGCKLIPIHSHELIVPSNLIKNLKRKKITIWFSVPTLICYINKFFDWNEYSIPSLKKIIFGGETFPKKELQKLFLKFTKTKFISVYGPTEGTCICSHHNVRISDFSRNEITKFLPLGKKMWRTFDYKIFTKNQINCKSKTGELYLSGSNITDGYLGGKNKNKFIKLKDQNNIKKVYYKTGDIVYMDKKNNIRFSGRLDNQIKYKGYRIELEEIQLQISSLKEVKDCIVTFGKKNKENEITAWLIVNQKTDIISKMSSLLPSYMIPKRSFFLKKFPKNANGKISRLKLIKDYYD